MHEPDRPTDPAAAQLYDGLRAFLEALDRGEDALEPWFTEAATMYFPFLNTPGRVEGRAAIVARFARMNVQLRRARMQPPYIGFGVRDFSVQWLSPGWALVTAVFTFADQWGRRTLLLQETTAGQWCIHHLHASNMTAPTTAPAPI